MPSKPEVAGDLRSTGSASGYFICTWTLKNFSKLGHTSFEKSYVSKSFQKSESYNDTCYLRIFPGGERKGYEGFVAVFLYSNFDYAGKMKLKLTVELRNTAEKIITAKTTECRECGIGWGYSDLIERKLLLPELTDDVLIIHVMATHTLTFVAGVKQKTELYAETNSELICNDMRRLQTEQKGADVVISVGKEDIPAHYAVLAARSKVFAAMFEHDTTEKKSRRVSITDFDATSIKSLLQFMYSGSLENLTIDLAEDMLRAADKYDIEDLKIYCSNYLISRFDKDNIVNIVITADRHNAGKLRENAVQFICDRKSEFDFEKHWSVFMSRSELLLDIVKSIVKKSLIY